MRRNFTVALVSLGLLLVGQTGCNDFLTGGKLSQNPNLPTEASARQLFVGVQAAQFAFQEGTVAMMMCEWVQSCNGTNSRFMQQAAQYIFNESSNIAANGGDWILVYGGGGLVDIRAVEDKVTASGDSTWLGIAKIWEAFTIGTASDMWGDVPYSEAGVNPQPVLDNRFALLGALQTRLDQAIAELQNGTGVGPEDADLVFGGNRQKWIRAAHTLKARFYMNTAESLGTPAYQNAITEALLGVNDATGGSDFASFHTTQTSERNMWAQFQTSSGFGPDVQAGKTMVDFMKARSDPRLAAYFCPNASASWADTTKYKPAGANPGSLVVDSAGKLQEVTAAVLDSLSGTSEPAWNPAIGGTTVDNHVTWTNRGLPYAGDDYNTPERLPASKFNCGQPARFADDASIPYVSYVENELILAEAYQATGNDANALTHLNNARAFANAKFSHSAPLQDLPALVGVTSGTGLLDSIMTEKWVAMFQNISVINDYRRTCLPDITPYAANAPGFANIPGRLWYPLNERNVNSHVPDPSVQLSTHGFRNAGDAHGCQSDQP